MSQTSAWMSWGGQMEPRRYPITCQECGTTGTQVGKQLPKGWTWRYTGVGLWYYCPNIVCWDRSWSRSREEWASA